MAYSLTHRALVSESKSAHRGQNGKTGIDLSKKYKKFPQRILPQETLSRFQLSLVAILR
jgi:hypothetical protein